MTPTLTNAVSVLLLLSLSSCYRYHCTWHERSRTNVWTKDYAMGWSFVMGIPHGPMDVLHHDVEIFLAEGQLVGHQTVRVNTGHRDVLILDAEALLVTEVAGRDVVDARIKGTHLQIDFRGPVGETEVWMRWLAAPDEGMTFTDEGVWTAFHTWNWMPASADPSERATLSLDVHAPDGWTVIATGDGDGPGPDAVSETPYPSYLYGFAAGNFEHITHLHDGVKFDVWFPAGDAEPHMALERTTRAYDRWETEFPGTWPLTTYVQVLVPGRAAQELAGMAFLSSSYGRMLDESPNEDWLIVHELAHQVWGNLVTCATWGDFWINEAFVVWWVARDKELRGDVAGYERELTLWEERVDTALADGDNPPAWRPGVSHDDAGGSIVYHRGALTVEAMRDWLGVEQLEHAMGVVMAKARDGRAVHTERLLEALLHDADLVERAAAMLLGD